MAKFKVGDRVRKAKMYGAMYSHEWVNVGACGTIVAANERSMVGVEKPEWLVKYDGYSASAGVDAPYCAAFSWMLEPITDTWAKEMVNKVTQLPVTA